MYTYDPITFQFDSDALRARWVDFRRARKVQPASFWLMGALYYSSVTLVVQWRGLNGSMGWLPQVQHVVTLLCFVSFQAVALCEYRRGWVESALRAVVGTDVDVRSLFSRVRVAAICVHQLLDSFTHLAVVMRSMRECSDANATTVDIIYCSSPIE